MFFIIIWLLVLVGLAILLERDPNGAERQYCRMECIGQMEKPMLNRFDGYMY
jgi:hypothetical protein